MSNILKKEEVEKLGKLANLPISESEKITFTKQVSSILSSVEAIQKLSLQGVSPTNQVTQKVNEFREDVTTASLSQQQALSMAKKVYKGYFVVKAVINHEN